LGFASAKNVKGWALDKDVLRFRPDEHGGKVTLAVRVLNVGKKEAKFRYDAELFAQESPDAGEDKGTRIYLGTLPLGKLPSADERPNEVILAPGKSVELYHPELELRPASETPWEIPRYENLALDTTGLSVQDDPWALRWNSTLRVEGNPPALPALKWGGPALYGPGRFNIQYKRVPGVSSKLNPGLSKLGTGKLTLEVQSSDAPKGR
jgi:hypothetical protein